MPKHEVSCVPHCYFNINLLIKVIKQVRKVYVNKVKEFKEPWEKKSCDKGKKQEIDLDFFVVGYYFKNRNNDINRVAF